MTITAMRYSKVCWLWNSDLDEGEKAIWDVGYHSDREHASCWKIPLYEVKSTCSYLVLKAVRGNGNDGGEISLSISGAPRFDVYAKESFAVVPAQSNPKRYVYRSRWDHE